MCVQINNGVYRSGFATTQGAYERAQNDLYTALDTVEQRLSQHRFLVGDRYAAPAHLVAHFTATASNVSHLIMHDSLPLVLPNQGALSRALCEEHPLKNLLVHSAMGAALKLCSGANNGRMKTT